MPTKKIPKSMPALKIPTIAAHELNKNDKHTSIENAIRFDFFIG